MPAMRVIFLTLILSGLLSFLVRAQDTIIPDRPAFDDPFIAWVGQYPSPDAMHRARLGERLKNLIFGGRPGNELIQPMAVMANNIDDYFILDQKKGSIIRVEQELGDITQFRNKAYKNFNSLVGISKFSSGKIIFSDSYLNKVFYFTPGRKGLGVLNDTVELNRPTGLAYSAVREEVWIVETGAHCISVLAKDGKLLRKIGTRGTAPGEFNFPTSIWIDNSGKVFIVDAMNFRVQVFSLDGELLSVFGKPGDASGYFARPRGIATDSEGNIYVTDALYNTIQVFDMEGNFLYNFGRQGRAEGEFWMPSGIFIDEDDHIYVADAFNARVQIFHFMKGKK